MEGTNREMTPDPVDDLIAVLDETLRANALRLTTSRGGYVGGGQPHPELASRRADVESIARGLLARKVTGPPVALTPCPDCPHWMELHNDDGSCGCGASHESAGESR